MRLTSGSLRLAVAALAALVLPACAIVRSMSATRPHEWETVVTARPVPNNPDLCVTQWEAARPPGRPWDRIGLVRLASCAESRSDGNGPAPAVQLFFLPGTHMNSTLVTRDESHELRLYLARRGIPVWTFDYRTHFVSPDVGDVRFMQEWTGELFLDDARTALRFVRQAGPAPVVAAGFSRGVTFACALAQSPEGSDLAGLVLLDGIGPELRLGRPEPPDRVAIDVGSQRLPYEKRRALLATVVATPHAPSDDPDFPTAAHRLAHIVYTSKTFGGRGGLSDALHGRADIQVVARLLASYDRYWPAAVRIETDPGQAPETARLLPVFAVASTNMGERFTRAVEATAHRYGGAQAKVLVLPGWGHLDVLVGTQSGAQVFEPLVHWLRDIPALDGG